MADLKTNALRAWRIATYDLKQNPDVLAAACDLAQKHTDLAGLEKALSERGI